MGQIGNEFESSSSPVARLLGHSLAVAIGFCGLALISMIPVGMIKLLIAIGMTQMAETLHVLENLLLTVDIVLFAVVFLSGVAVFAVETIASARRQIRKAWRIGNHDQ